ncbi:MAG: amidohydrolase family protein [Planctomycetes bacterium]|nr:amidohydrolase family protein [Planctomycetota bacterium]
MQRTIRSARVLLTLLLALWGGSAAAATAAQQDGGPDHYVVMAAHIFAPFDAAADAAGFVHDRWLEIASGRVRSLGQGEPPVGVELVDFGSAWLMPGLVDMGAEVFRGGDPDGLGPRYVAADKFNPFADFRKVWESGVTTARLGVPGKRFISGQGSVVKFGGDADTAVVLARTADLQLNFNDEAGRQEPDFENVPFPSSADVPYEPRPEPRPQTRLGRIAALKDDLAAARALPAIGPRDPRLGALASFVASGRPFRVDARRAADIVQALEALKAIEAYGVGAYLAGADEALALASSLGAAGLPVVYEVDNAIGRLGDGDWNPIRPWRRDASTPAALERAGVSVVLGGAGSDLLMAASIAVGGGLSPRAALEAISSRPARLLGVADRVGSLQNGRDADFLVLNGDPLSSLSHVQQVWVAGRRAFERKEDERPLVVRAGRILDGQGGVIRDGEILVEKGKIVAIGAGVPHPRNARIVDAGADAVVTPGFIDVHSHLGLENDRAVPAPELPLADALGGAGPEFADVARAGVTTALVAPRRVGSTGSQVVAIKTVGRDHADLIAKPVAAVKLAVGGSTDQVRSALTGLLSKGQKYHEVWKKYEDDLAAFKSGKVAPQATSQPSPEKKPEEPAKQPEAKKDEGKEEEATDPLSGVWSVTLSGGPMPKPQEGLTARIRLEGERVAGTITNPLDTDEEATFSGSFDGKTLRADVDVETPFGPTTLVAQLKQPEQLEGSVSLGGVMDIDLKAKRTKKVAPKITVPVAVTKAPEAAPGAPKAPNLDPKLEPLRAVFAGHAGVIVQVKGGPLVRVVSEVFDGYKVPVVILDGAGAIDVLAEIKGEAALALPHALVDETDEKARFLPEELERRGIPMAFQSSAGWGGQGLPLLARLAVRGGMGADAALRALTADAARLLRLDDTVGLIKQGLDGDLLIFDGDPFDTRSRLLKVFIRGQEVK